LPAVVVAPEARQRPFNLRSSADLAHTRQVRCVFDIAPLHASYSMPQALRRSFFATLRGNSASAVGAIDVPFDPKEVFGKARAAVVVSIKQHTYRSTIFTMQGKRFVPLRISNQIAAGVRAGDRVKITLTLDQTPRVVKVPADLAKALRAAGLLKVFKGMSFTHQREHVEAITSAKKPETRARRLAACLEMVTRKAASAKKPARRA
jgi:hypothetical protein